MATIYRATTANGRVADIRVVNVEEVVCVLKDKVLDRETVVQCRSFSQAEALIDKFLRIDKPY